MRNAHVGMLQGVDFTFIYMHAVGGNGFGFEDALIFLV